MQTMTYSITGMTCEHCVRAVSSEIAKLPGVTGVDVDLGAGTATVAGPVDQEAVRAAVDEAGYQLVEPRLPGRAAPRSDLGTGAEEAR